MTIRFIHVSRIQTRLAPEILTKSIVKDFVPARESRSRKGENGTVLVIGGSYIYHGAPILASMAAIRCGTDLVYTAVPKINVQSTRATSPDLIVIPMVDQKLTRGAVRKLLGQVPKGLDSAAIGMGLAVSERGALKLLIQSLLDADVRVVLDASSLVEDIMEIIPDKNTVLTPHAGEFKRLFGESPPEEIEGRAETVERLAQLHGVTILLKGPTDVISNGSATYLNPKKTPAMTVGGTGDVLSGLAAGMLAKNRNAVESASAAAFINGLAGARVQREYGLHATASDLYKAIAFEMIPFDVIK